MWLRDDVGPPRWRMTKSSWRKSASGWLLGVERMKMLWRGHVMMTVVVVVAVVVTMMMAVPV